MFQTRSHPSRFPRLVLYKMLSPAQSITAAKIWIVVWFCYDKHLVMKTKLKYAYILPITIILKNILYWL